MDTSLQQSLSDAGIREGDRIVVHSSLHAIGRDAQDVLSALTGTVGPRGTILMPTFTYCYEKRPGVQPFCRATSPSQTGYLSEAFRLLPGTVRSAHPTHSAAVWGADAEEIVSGHTYSTPPFDPGTPFHRMGTAHAKILLLGVDLRSCSMLHVAEFLARLPFLDIPNRPEYGYYSLVAGIGRVPLAKRLSGCSLGFNALSEADGYETVGERAFRFGDAKSRILDADRLLQFAVETLRARPDALMCPEGTCERCDRRRARLHTEQALEEGEQNANT